MEGVQEFYAILASALGVRLLSGFGVGPGELQVPLRRCYLRDVRVPHLQTSWQKCHVFSAVLSPLLFTRLIVKAMRPGRKIFALRSSHYGIYSELFGDEELDMLVQAMIAARSSLG